MAKARQRKIEVYADWAGLAAPTKIGLLYATPSRGKEIFSFEYESDWLSNDQLQALDPSLRLYAGPQYVPNDQENFGIFLDSTPDRWGRFLMKRREAQRARDEDRAEQKLLESDYLLGVFDEHRIGAMRFKLTIDGPFLDDNKQLAAPPWTTLQELAAASLAVEQDDLEGSPDYKKWLNMLIAPGGSLGGARPKASVLDNQLHPWIAKFPSRSDENDIGAWEMVVHVLAKRAGISTTPAKVERYNSEYHTFLSKRFDRSDDAKRIHFASALTLLQRRDGDDASNGTSYLELAEFVMKHGAQPQQDLEQLWRRIVFNMCVSNTDDHLRNHGFLLSPSHGWYLSPAFDMNPDPYGDGLKLNISESDNSQDLDLARDVAEYFDVKNTRADQIINEVIFEVRSWGAVAESFGMSKSAQNRMARAFRVAE